MDYQYYGVESPREALAAVAAAVLVVVVVVEGPASAVDLQDQVAEQI